jgi:hypothetical protein
MLAQRAAQRVGIIAFVRQQVTHAAGAFEERRHGLHAADVACCQHQCIGTADDVGERVDFRGPTAARTANRLY